MDVHDFRVLELFLKFVRDNAFVLKVHLEKKIDQHALAVLQDLIESDPSYRSIWILPTENGVDGVLLLRVALGGDPPYSLATEEKLQKMRFLLKGWDSDGSAHFNVKPIIISVPCASWAFWSIGQHVACQGNVPPKCDYDGAISSQRYKLRINLQFMKIMQALTTNTERMIICGGPDSGKRTEIVHYILEHCRQRQQPCRMVCVLQEEVEVLAAAEQLSKERNEQPGTTIGYKLNINSQVSEMNNAVFCTIQTLLLSLGSGPGRKMLSQLTYLIVDNVDSQTGEMNLLLSLLKEKQKLLSKVKLVLLSSSSNGVSKLSKFFDVTHVMQIPHNQPTVHYLPNKPFGVKYHHLGEILDSICTHEMIQNMKDTLKNTQNPLKMMAMLQVYYGHRPHNRNVTRIMDQLLQQCWFGSNASAFTGLLRLLAHNKHLVDYQHSETRVSALMIAGAKGYVGVTRELLSIGANPYIVGRKSVNALDWCTAGPKNPCWQIMNTAHLPMISNREEGWNWKILSQLYRKVHNPYIVDQLLVADVVSHICRSCVPGKILVMLPDVSDVLECYEMLQKCLLDIRHKVSFLIFHRMLTEEELKDNPELEGTMYVVILMAGPLLELISSLGTIDYVVDTGLKVHPGGDYAKGLCIDRGCMASVETARTLKWLAQRKCYTLYPEDYYDEDQTEHKSNPCKDEDPEIVLKALMCRPQPACLKSVETFFDEALIAKNYKSIVKSLELLEQIGAIQRPLKAQTSLGSLLVHLNVGIHLGKALLYAVLFKCLDPVLTIVAALKVGNPFVEPLDEEGESELMQMKFALHNRTYSDCMVVLRLYQQWSQAKMLQQAKDTMQNHHLRVGYMEALSNTRVELMSVLRLLGIVKCGRAHNTELLNVNSSRWYLVKGCLAAGLYPQLAIADYENHCLTAIGENELLQPHPLSVAQVENLPVKWVVYVSKLEQPLDLGVGEETSEHSLPMAQICDNTVITDWTLLLMCGVDGSDAPEHGALQLRKTPKPDDDDDDNQELVEFMLDRMCSFRLPRQYYHAVLCLRRKLALLFQSFTQNPLRTLELRETNPLVNYIMNILQLEDTSQMLGNVVVDTRPKIRNLQPMGAFWNYASYILDQSSRDQTENPGSSSHHMGTMV